MKSWKKTKRQRRRIKFLRGSLVLVKLNFTTGEKLELKKLAKECGYNNLPELIREAVKSGMKREDGSILFEPKK